MISLYSCWEEKEKDYEITIITQKIDDINKPYPDEIVSFLIPEKLKDCGDTTFQAKVKLVRIDLTGDVEEELSVPRNSQEEFLGAKDDSKKILSKFKNEVNIAKPFTESNGQLNEFKLQAWVRKYGGAKNVIGYNPDNSSFFVGGEGVMFYNSIDQLRQDLLKRVCNSSSAKFLILYNLTALGHENESLPTEGNLAYPPPFITDENPFTIELQKILVNIIQKNTTTEKLKLANETNEKYFNKQCIVKNYQTLNNPNIVDVYGSENGGLQYLRYLATDPSIYDIQIQKIERDLNTGKITALYVFEKHN